MNLEILQKRAEEIQNAMAGVLEQYKALLGHQAEVQYWITQLNEKKDEPVAPEEDCPVE
jgi:hypothetical protein